MELLKRLLIITFFITTLTIMGIATLDALDRSIYPGCRVVFQSGQMLAIDIDPDLTLSQRQKLIEKIRRSGYDVAVVENNNIRGEK